MVPTIDMDVQYMYLNSMPQMLRTPLRVYLMNLEQYGGRDV